MKAWELLTDPTHWTKGHLACNNKGESRFPHEKSVTCWCAVGAIQKCYPREDQFHLIHTLSKQVGNIPRWNDTSDHATVLAKLKELDI